MATAPPLGITCWPTEGGGGYYEGDPNDPYGGYYSGQYCETTIYSDYTTTVTTTVGGVVSTRTITTEKTIVSTGMTTYTVTATVKEGVTTTYTMTTTVVQGTTITKTITGVGTTISQTPGTITVTSTKIIDGVPTTIVTTVTEQLPGGGSFSQMVLPLALIGAGGIFLLYSRKQGRGG